MSTRNWALIGLGAIALYLIYLRRATSLAPGTPAGATGTAGAGGTTSTAPTTSGAPVASPGLQAPAPTCVAIRAANGRYVAAELGTTSLWNSGGRLTATRTAIGSWERFRLIPIDTSGAVRLQSVANGRYVAAGPNALWADRATPDNDGRFMLMPAGGAGQFGLQAPNGAYVSVTDDGSIVPIGGSLGQAQTWSFQQIPGC